ncbi:MAG: ATP-binding cassette domain-containing protein [Pseudomonadota bacterium]
MAAPPILTLSDITLGWGGNPLFAGLDVVISPSDRLCVLGRNGSGKSTLMKLAAGMIEPDGGHRFVKPRASVSYLPQEPDFAGFSTLMNYASADLDPAEHWRAEMALDGLKQSGSIDPKAASGGERRRAALARVIASDADLLLLDEPTNHLDIHAIEWLEGHLAQTKSAFALISHDRAFLTALARETLWLDRGMARRNPKGFAAFEDWRDKIHEEEEAQRHKLDRLIAQEAHWAVYGISARRTRNQGRLRRLEGLRQQRRDQITRTGRAAMELSSGEKSGKLVIEARGLSKSFTEKPIIHDFSLRLARGERVALVGPNGVGKTTLLKMLIGEVEPDAGSVKIGQTVSMAVFDQNRSQLDPEKTLWESLTEDKLLGVKGANDQVMVRGHPKHVVGYLKEFLFSEKQARGPVKALSGGERARLLLARIMARQSNLLVLDEPTNDLDIETLDLLQELVADFDGTVLVVSHDRDFLDRVATATIAMEGDGRGVLYPGGWSDYREQRAHTVPVQEPEVKRSAAKPIAAPKPAASGLTGKQEHRLKQLPAEIDRLEAEIAKLEDFLATPDLFTTAPEKFNKASAGLADRQVRLEQAEEEWLELEELRSEA